MEKTFKEIYDNKGFAYDREYESGGDHIPLEFYLKTFPISKTIDVFLGFYSSAVFKTLSHVMASFIYNGGSMRIITNEYLSEKDKKNLIDDPEAFNKEHIEHLIEKRRLNLDPESSHFYDCLKYLLSNGRLKIQPVKFNKFGNEGMEHKKQMVLYDGVDYISTNGSINLTLRGVIANDESFDLFLPWDDAPGTFRNASKTEKRRKTIDKIFKKKHADFEYLEASQIETDAKELAIDKEYMSLMHDSKKLKFSVKIPPRIKKLIEESKEKIYDAIKLEKKTPRFPYPAPYPYQLEACKEWVEANKEGLFEMATGTGKTLTAALCLIKEFEESGRQKNIIVVPGQELVRQWKEELKECRFSGIYEWYSGNNRLEKDKKTIKIKNKSIESDKSKLNIIVTYDSFLTESFDEIFQKDLSQYIVVFDEAHRMGAPGFMKAARKIKFGKTIGLSATPVRDWDENGANEFISEFFKSEDPLYSFPMEDAIKGRDGQTFLCEYNYHPYFCSLEEQEWEKYKELSRRIAIKDDKEKINFKAAIARQAVVDKAEQKREVVVRVLERLYREGNIQWTLVYCPKGEDKDAEDKVLKLIIDKVGEWQNKNNIKITDPNGIQRELSHYEFISETSQRDVLLKSFEKREVDILYAIKCLDEGVNVQPTRNAIFAASGKNKREFVQRRGRVLRKFDGKKEANIYDIIVIPTAEQMRNAETSSKNFLRGEFGRLIEFLEISKNKEKAVEIIDKKLKDLGTTYADLKKIVEENEKNRAAEKHS